MKRNPEITSARVAKIAARWLKLDIIAISVWVHGSDEVMERKNLPTTDFKAVFASALAQTADKPKHGSS